jgi:hypothetical protein
MNLSPDEYIEIAKEAAKDGVDVSYEKIQVFRPETFAEFCRHAGDDSPDKQIRDDRQVRFSTSIDGIEIVVLLYTEHEEELTELLAPMKSERIRDEMADADMERTREG